MKLTLKQELFAQTYIKTGNASEAYRTAYNVKSTNLNTINVKASKLLASYKISIRVQDLQKELQKKHNITKDKIIEELANIVFIKESEFYNNDGSVKLLSELTDAQKSALSQYSFKSVKVGDDEYKNIPVFKAQDKLKAIEIISKMLGYNEPEKQEIKHAGTVTILPEQKDEL